MPITPLSDVNSSPKSIRRTIYDWFTCPVAKAHQSVADDLARQLPHQPALLVLDALPSAVLLTLTAVLWDAFIALACAALVALAVLERLLLARRLERKAEKTWSDYAALINSGLRYATAIGIVGLVLALSEISFLILFTGMVGTGITLGICLLNSALPRYAFTQCLLVILPFISVVSVSGQPEALYVLLVAPIWLLTIYLLINTAHRHLAAMLESQQHNKHLAYSDSLTGLANRAQLMASLNEINRSAIKTKPGHYLLYLDLDGFKAINDTYGHQSGDEFLQATATRLTNCVRGGDLVSRYGGDEFVIILRNINTREIGTLADRLTKAVAQPFMLSNQVEVSVGVSIGGAPLEDNPESTIAQADAMLYATKREARGSYSLSGL